jgi:UDP-3-O-[3-hydroxymyristoyl] glucosamine N-acyltransferase
VHPTAVLGENVRLGTGVSVGAHCVVGAGSALDDGAVLHPGVFVGAGVRVGARSVLFSACVLYHRVVVGRDCVIHSGAVIGADGFGFDPTPEGWRKVPQCGTVVVEDDVEIGANTTIDRGRFGATRIGAGAKLDNLVHVAHNVVIGPGALLIAQVGIAGSSRIGARAILAGQVGVVGHVEVGPGARISAQSGVTKDLPGGKDYFGSPVLPQVEALRRLASMNKLPELARRVRELEERLARLEGEG